MYMKLRLTACLLALLLLSAPARATEDGPFGIALSWTDDPETTITAVWRDGENRVELLQLTTLAAYNLNGFAAPLEVSAEVIDVSLDGSGVWHYEATVTGLEPNTAYAYRVGCEAVWSEARFFTTADPDAETLTFAYLGDVQPQNDSAAEFALWGELTQAMYARNPVLSFAILGGDIVNSGISQAQFDAFFAAAQPVFGSVPLFSTIGNHESNLPGGKPELFLDLFAFPQNGPEGFTEEFYSFDCGPCHVLSLNSWVYSGEQKLTEADYARIQDWIAADLAASAEKWQIVVTHVPVYAVHSDTTAEKVRENWASMLEKYGADLVFEGHQHVYSRSYPMLDGKIDHENGLTYIMGVSGSKFYDAADETRAARTVYNTATYELVQIDGDSLTVQALDADGGEIDFAVIPKRGITATRGAYIETLWRGAGSPKPESASPFTDAAGDAFAWAYEAGILYGYGSGLAGPEDSITQWQIDLILERMENAA